MLKAAFITGAHPYEVLALHDMLDQLKGIRLYPQSLEEFTNSSERNGEYDVLIFYNMHKPTPQLEDHWPYNRTREVLEKLGETGQGILVLHHGLLAFPEWELWSELTGLTQRTIESYHYGQELLVEPADGGHPLTKGMSPWELTDETYRMAAARQHDGNQILLKTAHAYSTPTLAWTRRYRQAQVLCMQPGHGSTAFQNEDYRKFLEKGLHWLAGKPLF
jgi:hypothetical protein